VEPDVDHGGRGVHVRGALGELTRRHLGVRGVEDPVGVTGQQPAEVTVLPEPQPRRLPTAAGLHHDQEAGAGRLRDRRL
jgi:hypothetical protein